MVSLKVLITLRGWLPTRLSDLKNKFLVHHPKSSRSGLSCVLIWWSPDENVVERQSTWSTSRIPRSNRGKKSERAGGA